MDYELSDEQLLAEELRLIDRSVQMGDQVLQLFDDAERFRVGPQANQERYRQLLAAYWHLHGQHLQVYATFVRVHEEIMRRGLR